MATYRSAPEASITRRSTLLGSGPLRIQTLSPGSSGATDASEAVARRINDLWTQSYGGTLAFDPDRSRRERSQALHRIARLETAGAQTTEQGTAIRSATRLSWTNEMGEGASCEDPVCIDADQLAIVGWASGGSEIIFQARAFETVSLLAWRTGSDRVRAIATTEGVLGSDASGTSGQCEVTGQVAGQVANHMRGEEAICILAAADQPPRLVAIDLKSGRERILLDPNPQLAVSRLGIASRITLKDRFGNETIGRLILPPSRQPGEREPLVITSYTCRGFLLGGSGRDVPEHVLAGLGYASVCVDLGYDVIRHAPDFQIAQDNAYLSFLDFFEDAVRVLDAAGVADPQRVSLNGFSGSATSTTFAISQSTLFTAAAVTTEGSLDPIVCWLTTQMRSCEKQARAQGLSRPYDSVMRNSPALNVERIQTPLLMQLPEVEYVSMLQLYSAMRDYDRAVDMYIFPGAYHFKNQPRQRLAVYERNIAWIEFWLRGREPAEAPGAGQVARWRSMREAQCALTRTLGAKAPWYCRS